MFSQRYPLITCSDRMARLAFLGCAGAPLTPQSKRQSLSLDPGLPSLPHVAQLVKDPPAIRETWVQSLGWEDPWRREWLPTPVFYYSGLENSMDCIVRGVTKSRTWLSNFHFSVLGPVLASCRCNRKSPTHRAYLTYPCREHPFPMSLITLTVNPPKSSIISCLKLVFSFKPVLCRISLL